jgi:hypothetical protein
MIFNGHAPFFSFKVSFRARAGTLPLYPAWSPVFTGMKKKNTVILRESFRHTATTEGRP